VGLSRSWFFDESLNTDMASKLGLIMSMRNDAAIQHLKLHQRIILLTIQDFCSEIEFTSKHFLKIYIAFMVKIPT
jgi:hypothetical protein